MEYRMVRSKQINLKTLTRKIILSYNDFNSICKIFVALLHILPEIRIRVIAFYGRPEEWEKTYY